MLFMGQEFAASTPFLFFTDFDLNLGRLVTDGRRAEFAAFRVFTDPEMRDSIPDPQAEATFLASKLDLAERKSNAPIYRLYQELLALRRGDPVLSTGDRAATRAFAVGAQIIVVHRWLGTAQRVLVANFGAATSLPFAETPGLEGMAGADWRLLLSTADQRFGGSGHEAGLCDGERDRRVVEEGAAAVGMGVVDAAAVSGRAVAADRAVYQMQKEGIANSGAAAALLDLWADEAGIARSDVAKWGPVVARYSAQPAALGIPFRKDAGRS